MSTVMQVEQLVAGPDKAKVWMVRPRQCVAEAARIMAAHDIGCVLVVDEEEKIVGILTERDVISKVVGRSLDSGSCPVETVMTRKVVACGTSTPIARAQQVMADHGIRHLPIVQAGRPVAMISSRDVLSHQLATVQAVARRQSKVLDELETQHPGISRMVKDCAGRIVI